MYTHYQSGRRRATAHGGNIGKHDGRHLEFSHQGREVTLENTTVSRTLTPGTEDVMIITTSEITKLASVLGHDWGGKDFVHVTQKKYGSSHRYGCGVASCVTMRETWQIIYTETFEYREPLGACSERVIMRAPNDSYSWLVLGATVVDDAGRTLDRDELYAFFDNSRPEFRMINYDVLDDEIW